ncbi:MAG: helix-turn-helix transcriptional regulator [Cyclobacteriaceae bacterium]|nr:helix-turn-helix transcriptional regulator [Cyclobacteriaceae bacterium HetDA_MAG_MS6]
MGSTKGGNIGEFEELALLVVGTLNNNAYGVSVRNFLMEETGRKVNISAVHEVLKRLEKKAYIRSEIGGSTEERGGRRKKLFFLTAEGKQVLDRSRELRNGLYNRIPELKFNFSGLL